MTFLNEIINFLNDPGLLSSLGLTILIVAVSWSMKLKLTGELLWVSFRGFLQLTLIGFFLVWLFSLEQFWTILLTLLVMVILASLIVRNRGKSIPNIFTIIFISIFLSSSLVLGLLLLGQSIEPNAKYLVPFGGMLIGNCMQGAGLALNRLKSEIQLNQDEILLHLSLGASPYQATKRVLQETLQASMIPVIDGMKAIGIIMMPGTMAGLILAGDPPLLAVRYQIIALFMIFAGVVISNLLVVMLSYRQFFTKAMQLKPL